MDRVAGKLRQYEILDGKTFKRMLKDVPTPWGGNSAASTKESVPGQTTRNTRERENNMPIQLIEKNGGRILEVLVSGKLAHEDYQHFVPEFERLVKQNGKIRVLFEMANFHGWEMSAVWDDIKFDIKHFSDIDRLAMVGDKKWEKGMSVFCKPFTTAKIRYFDTAASSEARAWLEQIQSA
ncbi:MAG TPA: STAS/SEC14 domain-containing protein [Verrucomicrobiae bacterium]|nr:STAS/SEC14 domain-containing protein [Verrucomicrobiae bacterium]